MKSKLIVLIMVIASLALVILCGCTTPDWIHVGPVVPPDVVVGPAPTNVSPVVTPPVVVQLWPAYSAPSFFGHGYDSENTYRQTAIDAARAQGHDCIRCDMIVHNPEVSIHLLNYESNVDKGKFLGESWFFRARNQGITRWQVDISSCVDDAATIYDRFKAYDIGTLQFCGVEFTPALQATLHCNANGEKNTAPEYRQ